MSTDRSGVSTVDWIDSNIGFVVTTLVLAVDCCLHDIPQPAVHRDEEPKFFDHAAERRAVVGAWHERQEERRCVGGRPAADAETGRTENRHSAQLGGGSHSGIIYVEYHQQVRASVVFVLAHFFLLFHRQGSESAIAFLSTATLAGHARLGVRMSWRRTAQVPI